MNKKTLLSFMLSIVLLLTPVLTVAASPQPSLANDNEYTFIDENNTTTKIVQEEDGTIKVYLNGVLDHSAKTDLDADILVYTKYNNEAQNSLSSTSEPYTTTILKPSDYITEDAGSSITIENPASDVVTPFSTAGYTYKASYTDTFVTQLTAKGYTKDGGITRTSEKKVSISRGTAIGAAVSIAIAALTGPITVAVVTSAIVGAYAGVILDGIFTKNVIPTVHYEDRWILWKGVVNSWEFDSKQGTRYLRVISDYSGSVITKPTNLAKLGYTFDFTDFLQTTITRYTNR
ncbi:hypothetical protein ASD24_19625 [Paenibacillus sp. Root52]|uniref:hypothetical protein n=1 Tax=Paenibacillus sp. Root52 TaxID=1736552 RepID=UPI0007001053|nr:hypothetical protein [Paenibacillus sp. Root52]KQY79551.1 hypothetical protein ASD24_19625 [Paenibacillus sp. Root52]